MASWYGSSSKPAAADWYLYVRVLEQQPLQRGTGRFGGAHLKGFEVDSGRRSIHKEGLETVDRVVPEALQSFYVAGGQGDKRRRKITEIGRPHPSTTSRLEFAAM